MVLRLNSGQGAAAQHPPTQEGLVSYTPPREPDLGTRLVHSFTRVMRDLTEPDFFLPIMAARGVFGLSRMALLGLAPRGLSAGLALARANLGAFALEGLAFTGSARALHHLKGKGLDPEVSFAQELGHAYLTMGLLKTFGGATSAGLLYRYQKIPAPLLSLFDKAVLTTAPQLAQFGGIYLSHTLAPHLGLGHYIDPAERAFQSAVAVLQFGAADLILNQVPGYAQANQRIHFETDKLKNELIESFWKNHPSLPMGSLAAVGIGSVDPRLVPSPALRNQIWMNASSKDGTGKDEPKETLSESEPPSSGTALKRYLTKLGLEETDDDMTRPLPDDRLLGQTIDYRYKVEKVLGEGGMGKVYKGLHTHLNKPVAIKVLKKDLAGQEEIQERFVNEARAASAIGNDHIIHVGDIGTLPNGSIYIIMEFLKGRSLGDLTAEGRPLPLDQLLNISLQVTEGMAAAHDKGIVHRDLKPDNIFLTQEHALDKEFVKILDFGIAKIPSDRKLTVAGKVFGTPDYISPEQARGSLEVDQRSDIYAMGAILYEMATGKLPFTSPTDDPADILRMHLFQDPLPPSHFNPDPKLVSSGLEKLILKCLQKNPEERYQSMDELKADLRAIEQGNTPGVMFSIRPEALSLPPSEDLVLPPPPRDLVSPLPPHLAAVRTPWMKDWRIWAGLFGATLAGGTIANLLRKDKEDSPPIVPSALPSAHPAPKEKEPAIVTPAPAQEVKLKVEPANAHIFINDQDQGEGHLSMDIPPGEKVEVEVRKRGYKPQRLVLDSSQPEVTVKLKPQGREPMAKTPAPAVPAKPKPVETAEPTKPLGTPKPSPAPKSKPKPSPSSDDNIVNPWN